MQSVNLGSVIEQAINRVTQNRIGQKPAVFVTLSPALTQVPWKDRALKTILVFFLYESLLTSGAGAPIEITLRRRSLLKDLTAFVGIRPSYWVQVRVAGRGLKVLESHIDDLFSEVGYRCEEWVGIEGSSARLGIFGGIDALCHILNSSFLNYCLTLRLLDELIHVVKRGREASEQKHLKYCRP
jgi:hypothetical protein